MSVLPKPALNEEERALYRRALELLNDSHIRYLVGGAYAFARYTGIDRFTKDFDLFLRERDYEAVASVLEGAGFRTELTFPHWLGKAFHGDYFIDLIYGSGNGIAVVDEGWFEHAVEGEVLDTKVKLIPAEEMIWSKAFIQERERYDGADVIHLIHRRGGELDWHRLLDRFGEHWRALLSHLILYGFVYPGERHRVPVEIMKELLGRLDREIERPEPAAQKVCFGPILSREQYLNDVHELGYEDARLKPRGSLTGAQIQRWTYAIGRNQ